MCRYEFIWKYNNGQIYEGVNEQESSWNYRWYCGGTDRMYTDLKFYFSARDSVYININIYWLVWVDFFLCQKPVYEVCLPFDFGYSFPPTRVMPTVCHRPEWSLWFIVLMLVLDRTPIWNIVRWSNFNYSMKLKLHRENCV